MTRGGTGAAAPPAISAGGVLAAAVVLFTLAACGGAPSAERSPEAAPVDTNRVGMVPHYRFDPVVVRVEAGASVTWRNSDDFTHAVRLDRPGAAAHVVPPGDSVRLEFDSPGEYAYVCGFHPHDMSGRVIVEPAR